MCSSGLVFHSNSALRYKSECFLIYRTEPIAHWYAGWVRLKTAGHRWILDGYIVGQFRKNERTYSTWRRNSCKASEDALHKCIVQ